MLVYFLLKYGSTGTWVEKNSVLYFKGRTILHGLDIDIQLSGYHQQYSVPMIDAHWALPSPPWKCPIFLVTKNRPRQILCESSANAISRVPTSGRPRHEIV